MAWMLLGAATAQTPPRLARYEYSQLHMGVRVDLKLYAPTQAQAEWAATAAFARFAALEAVMSDYRPDSELMRLCAQAGKGPVPISADLFRVLSRSQEVAERSGGAFDITASPVIRLWRQARRTGQLPFRSEVLNARAKVDWRYLRLDPRKRTAEITQPGVLLDLGGIAKGDACDEAMKVLRQEGVRRAIVEAGGDIAASGPPPGERGWRVGVPNRKEPLLLRDGAVSTSGDASQFVDVGGRRFSHIVDPKTGYGLTNRVQVTIFARDALTTDSLATALSVLPSDVGQRLAGRYGARVVYTNSATGE